MELVDPHVNPFYLKLFQYLMGKGFCRFFENYILFFFLWSKAFSQDWLVSIKFFYTVRLAFFKCWHFPLFSHSSSFLHLLGQFLILTPSSWCLHTYWLCSTSHSLFSHPAYLKMPTLTSIFWSCSKWPRPSSFPASALICLFWILARFCLHCIKR